MRKTSRRPTGETRRNDSKRCVRNTVNARMKTQAYLLIYIHTHTYIHIYIYFTRFTTQNVFLVFYLFIFYFMFLRMTREMRVVDVQKWSRSGGENP